MHCSDSRDPPSKIHQWLRHAEEAQTPQLGARSQLQTSTIRFGGAVLHRVSFCSCQISLCVSSSVYILLFLFLPVKTYSSLKTLLNPPSNDPSELTPSMVRTFPWSEHVCSDCEPSSEDLEETPVSSCSQLTAFFHVFRSLLTEFVNPLDLPSMNKLMSITRHAILK